MPNDIKIFIIICAVVACILIAAIVYLIKPKDVAIVQNSRITGDEFKYYYSQNLQAFASYMQYAESEEDQQSILNYAKQMALNQAVEIEYTLQEAKKAGFKADQKEMNDGWANMEKNITDAAAAYQMDINKFSEQSFGVSLNKVKTIYMDAFTAQKYMEKKVDEVELDETKLAAFYEENRASFDYNKVSHILITCARDAEDAVAQEKNKAAQDILDRVNKGEDFAALAKEFSEDEGSKDTGGTYDVYQDTNFVPEFMEWTFAAKVGETGIIRTDHGFHVMKLDAINNTLDANRDYIAKSYQTNEYQTRINDLMNDGTIKVEILEGLSEF